MAYHFSDAEDVRRAVERELEAPLTEAQWRDLLEENYVAEVLNGEVVDGTTERTPADLAALVRRRRDTYGVRRTAGAQARGVESSAGPQDIAVSELYAIVASKLEAVRRFRDEVLDGRTIPPNGVRQWIEKHRGDPDQTTVVLRVQVPRSRVRGGLAVARLESGKGRFVYEPPWASPPLTIDKRHPADAGEAVLLLEFAEPDGQATNIPIDIGGTLGRLHALSHLLAREVPWMPPEATTFVLTGRWPVVPAISAFERNRTSVSLNISPTASPREVARRYAHLRRESFAPILEPPTRSMSSPKRLRLGLFAERRVPGETWAQTMARWNRAADNAKDRYLAVALFHRDSKQANRRLRRRAGLPEEDRPTPVASEKPVRKALAAHGRRKKAAAKRGRR